MADINLTDTYSKKRVGVGKLKKRRTFIDLTPMVDLGFLLITFFIFTTTMSQPTSVNLVLPNDKDPGKIMATKESGVLTLLISKDNFVYYYEGNLESNIYKSTTNEIRDIIIKKKRNTVPENLFIIIKPAKNCTYKDIVNMLDEMAINDIKRYALVDITDTEEQLLKVFSEE